jgi:hypothetical protein
MNSQLAVGWLAILFSFALAAGALYAAARSVGAKPVTARRVMSGLAIGTVAHYVMLWMIVTILWTFTIVIELEWLLGRHFVWIFQSLLAPWQWLWSFV